MTQAHTSIYHASARARVRTGIGAQEFKPMARSQIESYSGEAGVELLPHGVASGLAAPVPGPGPAPEISSPAVGAGTRGSIARRGERSCGHRIAGGEEQEH